MTNSGKEVKAPVGQKGVALIVALVFLLAMTAIGVSSFVNTTMQERMVNSSRQADIAAQAAIIAQRAAEQWLQNNLSADLNEAKVFSAGCQGFYQPAAFTLAEETFGQNPVLDYPAFVNGFNYYDDQEWNDSNSRSVGGVLTATSVSREPRYIIELLGMSKDCSINAPCDLLGQTSMLGVKGEVHNTYAGQFRITAIGWGRDESIYRLVQSTVRVALANVGFSPVACPTATVETR